MKLRTIAKNQTELTRGNGIVGFFSYNTLSAVHLPGIGFWRAPKFSATTSRHVNKWLDGARAIEVPENELTALFEGDAS